LIQHDVGKQRRKYAPNAKDNFEFEKILRYRKKA
jgi:hypothetical protein